MKIAYILKKFPRHSETFILNELLALEAHGHEVEVFSLREPDDEPRHEALARLRAPVTVVRPLAPKTIWRRLEELDKAIDNETARHEMEYVLGRIDLTDHWRQEALALAVPLAPMIRERGIEHMHAHFATSAAATADEVSHQTGVPFSFTMHAKDIYRHTVNFDTLSGCMERSAFCVTVCEANAQWLRAHCSAEACRRLRVLYNGIDLSHWTLPARRDRIPGRIVAVGRFVQKKGFDDLLRAAGILRDQGRSFSVHLVGYGEEEAALKTMAADMKLEEWVTFTGPLSQDQVKDRVIQSQVLAAPCIQGDDGNQDALPTVLLEAMALGTPCIGTPIGGIPEIINDGVDGWIVPPRDPGALAAAIAQILGHPDLIEEKGRSARRHAEEQFDLMTNAGRLAHWFEDSAALSKSTSSQSLTHKFS